MSLFEITKTSVFEYYFPENFRCNLTIYESENCSYSSLHHIFESENFSFLYSTNVSLKCEKLNSRKS